MHHSHADDERVAVSGRESGRYVHQVPDRSGTKTGIPGDAAFHGDAATHAEREQSPGKTVAFRCVLRASKNKLTFAKLM